MADAGPDQNLSSHGTVILDGSDSYDPDGDPIAYLWSQTGGPSVTLSSETVAQPSFTTSSDGTYVFVLTVSDGTLVSNADQVVINVATEAPPEGGGSPDGGNGGNTGGGTIISPPTDDNTKITSVFNFVTSSGKFNGEVIVPSSDGNVKLTIPKDTVGTNSMGLKLMNIGITKLTTNKPSPPDEAIIVGSVYDIFPEGARFTPTILLSMEYPDSDLPAGVARKNLKIANYDWTTGQWQPLPSVNLGTSNTVVTELEHFSTYAILAYTRDADISVTQISTSSDFVAVGTSMDIQALVINNGDLTDSYEVTCLVDGVLLDTQVVTLDGGDSILVTFSVTPETTGAHTIQIGAFATNFTATEPDIPATFTTSSISVSPSVIYQGESVDIKIVVHNIGDLTGDYEAVLKMDNEYVDSKTVSISGGDSEIIVFTLEPKTIGDHAINIGDKITAGQVICIIEAMKIMNEIESEVSGTVIEILVDNAQPVEYNQPLVVIEPS